jgi:hypothetical protein
MPLTVTYNREKSSVGDVMASQRDVALTEPSELIPVRCVSAASGPEPVAVRYQPEHLYVTFRGVI